MLSDIFIHIDYLSSVMHENLTFIVRPVVISRKLSSIDYSYYGILHRS